MRVLVVEDERDVGDVVVDYLLVLGHQPLLVRSAEAALAKLMTERPDAILLDVNLPGMSGLDFLQLKPIRESGVPIIAVSGVATESQARQCLRLGAVDFLGKPLLLDRLREVLACLEPQALERTLDAPRLRPNRRQHTRVPLTVPVRVAEYGGAEWNATSVDLSIGGLRLSGRVDTRAGTLARLAFTPPDGGATLTIMALLVRMDIGGYAFSFVKVGPAEAARLRLITERLF